MEGWRAACQPRLVHQAHLWIWPGVTDLLSHKRGPALLKPQLFIRLGPFSPAGQLPPVRLTVCAGCNHACECWGSSLLTATSLPAKKVITADVMRHRPFPHLYCTHSPVITGGWFQLKWFYGLNITGTVKAPVPGFDLGMFAHLFAQLVLLHMYWNDVPLTLVLLWIAIIILVEYFVALYLCIHPCIHLSYISMPLEIFLWCVFGVFLRVCKSVSLLFLITTKMNINNQINKFWPSQCK